MFESPPGKKICCQCGKDVASTARKKDTHGRYWCLVCDESERKLARIGFKETVKTSISEAGAKPAAERARMIKMLSIMGALAVAAAFFHFFVFN